jgi:hypothetical protein
MRSEAFGKEDNKKRREQPPTRCEENGERRVHKMNFNKVQNGGGKESEMENSRKAKDRTVR